MYDYYSKEKVLQNRTIEVYFNGKIDSLIEELKKIKEEHGDINISIGDYELTYSIQVLETDEEYNYRQESVKQSQGYRIQQLEKAAKDLGYTVVKE